MTLLGKNNFDSFKGAPERMQDVTRYFEQFNNPVTI